MTDPVPSKKRDTPKTDAAAFMIEHAYSKPVVPADFARNLERELDEAHEEIEYFETGCARKDEKIADLKRDNVRWENAHKILLAENERLRKECMERFDQARHFAELSNGRPAAERGEVTCPSCGRVRCCDPKECGLWHGSTQPPGEGR
jgi:hypothetical protein